MKNKRIKINNYGVSETIGTVLMVVITISLASALLVWISSQDKPNEKSHVDLIADLELHDNGGIINILHRGGENLYNDSIVIYVDINENRYKLTINEGEGWKNKTIWQAGEKWSKYFADINPSSKVFVMVIDTKGKEILMKGFLQKGWGNEDKNPPIISMTWCTPDIVLGDETFKIYALIIDPEGNLPTRGSVTVNTLPISKNEAEPLIDINNNGKFETRTLTIKNEIKPGKYVFNITAKDSFNNVAKSNVSLFVGEKDNTAPNVEIIQPEINTFQNSTPIIIANYEDNINGSGIDTSSIFIELDDKKVLVEEGNITNSQVIFSPKNPLFDGIHSLKVFVSDKIGNSAETTLNFITGGFTESWNTISQQNFTILDQKGKQKNNFEEGELIRIRVTSSRVENVDNINKITIYSSEQTSKTINNAFTKITNTNPYKTSKNCYASVFYAPEEGFYMVKIELEDDKGNKFVGFSNITIGNPSSFYYLETFKDPTFKNKTTSFNSNEFVYVKIVAPDNEEVSNLNSENIYIDDYLQIHKLFAKPGSNIVSNVVKTIWEGHANYTFSIDLSKSQNEFFENSNWYTLYIKGLRNQENELIFKGATQIKIRKVNGNGMPDLEIDENDISFSNETLTIGDCVEINATVHNIGYSKAFNFKVGFWEGNNPIGTKTISELDVGSIHVTIQWNITYKGTIAIMVFADPYYELQEVSEINNLATINVVVREPILLVDDDDGNGESWNVNIEEYWQEALDTNGYSYTLYEVGHEENGPDFNTLKEYKAVIWFCGRDNSGSGATLTITDQNNLAMYLEDKGNLWVISQSLLYVMSGFSNDNPLTNSFAHNYLGVKERTEDDGTADPLIGVDGDPITDSISYSTSSSIFSGSDFGDDIVNEPYAVGIFNSHGNRFGAVRYENSNFKTVFFAFEFVFIEDANNRAELAYQVLNWLGINPIRNDVGVSELDCYDTISLNQEVNISAEIRNYGVNNQNNFEVCCEVKASNGTTVFQENKLISIEAQSKIKRTWIWLANKTDDYTITITTLLANDENNSNNEISKQISVVPFLDNMESDDYTWTNEGIIPVTIFSEDFEEGNLNNWEVHANIDDEIVDTLEFDTVKGKNPNIIHISDNIYAIPYCGNSYYGLLKTVEISINGEIINTIDTLVYETNHQSETPKIISISSNIYVLAYCDKNNDGFLKTIEIKNDGTITDTTIDTFEFDTNQGKTPDIIHISGNIYAIAYTGEGDDGFLKTVEIENDGTITDTIIDTLEFDTNQGKTPNIIHISGNIYAIAYTGEGGDGFLKTVEIENDGTIIDTVIDTLEFDTSKGKTPDITHVFGNIYAIVYEGVGNDGFLKIVEIATDGTITNTILHSIEFDPIRCKTPTIISISNNVYAITYEGAGYLGILKKIEISTNGQITVIIDTLVFDMDKGKTPITIHISNSIYAIVYCGKDDDGFLKTVKITSGNYDAGIVTISNTEAYNGTYCVKFYGDGEEHKEMWIQRNFNLEGLTNVYLTWYWHDEDLEQNDYGYISIYDGEWHNDVITLWNGNDEDHSTSPQDYEEVGNPMTLRLDEEYNMINGFIIRFGCFAKHEERYDCLLLDNIKISAIRNGNLWHKVNKRAHSGNFSFWCGDDNKTKYISYMDNSLISQSINLTTATSASLSFWHYCDFEDYKDGGIVEISIDNGSTWTQLTPNGGYDGIINEPTNSLDGREAFCLDTNGWEKKEFNLTPYVGYKILLRFRFGSSSMVNQEGWYIDDLAIMWGD